MCYFVYTTFTAKPAKHIEQLLLSDIANAKVEMATNETKDASFHKKLDEAGPYTRDANGVLTSECMLGLKRLITEKAYLDFRDRREELLQERINLMKQQKQQEYMTSVLTSLEEYRAQTQKVTA